MKPLLGYSALVTAGATRERIDPVRFITNDSSGKQGYAIAAALAESGASVTLVSGITQLRAPDNLTFVTVESARDMLDACQRFLPVNIAVCAAAVADFRPAHSHVHKIKKKPDVDSMQLELVKNPDILALLATHPLHRPELVIGFAAETEHVTENAQLKLQKKRCNWILANDVSQGVFNSDENKVQFITHEHIEHWDRMSKAQLAAQLVERIVTFFH